MAFTESQIIEKVRKLLALATSPNEHEASLALAKAHELLAKYNLDLATVETAEPGEKPNVVEEEQVLGSDSWRRALLDKIARANYTRLIIVADRGHLVGRMHNVRIVQDLYGWVESQLLRLARETWKTGLAREGERRPTFTRSFLLGAATRIGQRLRDAQGGEQDQIKALVVRYGQENEDYLRDRYGTLQQGRSTRLSGSGWSSGYDAGGQVSLSGTNAQVGQKRQLKGGE